MSTRTWTQCIMIKTVKVEKMNSYVYYLDQDATTGTDNQELKSNEEYTAYAKMRYVLDST